MKHAFLLTNHMKLILRSFCRLLSGLEFFDWELRMIGEKAHYTGSSNYITILGFFLLNSNIGIVLLMLDVKFQCCCVVDCQLYFIGEKNAHWNGLVIYINIEDLADHYKQQLQLVSLHILEVC